VLLSFATQPKRCTFGRHSFHTGRHPNGHKVKRNGIKAVIELVVFSLSQKASLETDIIPTLTILNKMKGFGIIFSFVFAAGAAASNVVELTPQNFDDIVLRSGKPTMVKFFAVSFSRLFSVTEKLTTL
jgi:hypothetical protein